jgi:hypothetical protein
MHVIDSAILAAVDVWIRLRHRRLWRQLRRRQRAFDVTQIRVALPRLANEKFLWRKIFDHDPRFIIASDKIASKEWVKEQGINVRVPETLWTGTDAALIPDAIWQRPVYIKAAHGWQMNIPVLSPPGPEEKQAIIVTANGFLAQSHGESGGEWGYAAVPRRLIVEEAISTDQELIEVKYYTFGPLVEQMVVRRAGPPVTAARWRRQKDGSFARSSRPTAISDIIDLSPLPDIALQGQDMAAAIGAHFDHMRVDTLIEGDQIYLGELTVYSMSGQVHLDGHKLDEHLNRSWDIRRSWFLTHPQPGWRGLYAAALRRRLNRLA